MKITDALLGEHGVFYAQFAHLEQTIPAVERLDLIHGQAALLTAALATHAHLEDELLFNALEPHIGEMGPLMVMRQEHDEIDGTLTRLPDEQDVANARRMLLHVIGTARDHFAKEEQILYPLAQRCLSADALTQLGAQWAQQRAVMV